MRNIEFTVVDAHSTGYGTFQSYNQKVVSNANGIFTTHIRTRNSNFTVQQWRLSRSQDGKIFQTVYEATDPTNPPVLETDDDNNLYLARPDVDGKDAYFYQFLARNDYQPPRRPETIANGSESGQRGAKYAMTYDAADRFYYFSRNNSIFAISRRGRVLWSNQLLRPSANAELEYPLLAIHAGQLHAAWTTSYADPRDPSKRRYYDLHYARSSDGGNTWKKLDGTAIALPAIADHMGPTDEINSADERGRDPWLANMLAKEGKVHFLYLAQTQPWRQHYVRYDLNGGATLNVWPEFRGQHIALEHPDGFFASDLSRPGSPLYCISKEKGRNRLACLVSSDNGGTWNDHAVSNAEFTKPYSIGGCREVTRDGYIIGAFTDALSDPQDPKGISHVYFFRIVA